MDALRMTWREHAAGIRSGWPWLPALLGLLLIGACSRQSASPPPPGDGEPRIQQILLLSQDSDGLGEASGPVAPAVPLAAEDQPRDVERAAGDQLRAFDLGLTVVLDSDVQKAGDDEPRMVRLPPLVDTRVHGLSDMLAEPRLRGDQARLVAGVRPAGDAPSIGCQVTGRRLTESDWLLQQENAAAWVTGAPAPAAGVPLVLIATFIENEHGGHLRATLVCREFGPLRTPGHTLMPGEFLFLALTDARSIWEEVAVAGDSVRVINLGRAAVVFEALQPGTTGVEVLEHQSWNEGAPRTISRFEIRVLPQGRGASAGATPGDREEDGR